MNRCTLFLFLILSPLLVKSQGLFFGDLKQGVYDIGFKTQAISDSSRVYNGGPRPLLLSIWYPAQSANEDQLRFEDYILIDAAKASLKQPEPNERSSILSQFIEQIERRGAKINDLKRLLKTSTNAYHNLAPIKGDFPVIFSLQGGGRPASTHFILNEYLASHGYLVVSFSDIFASPLRMQNTATENMKALDLDLTLAISAIKSNSPFPVSSIGVIGFSKAGAAVISHQSRHHDLGAFVAMDAQPSSQLMSSLPVSRLENINFPILSFVSNHQKKTTHKQALEDKMAFEFLPKSQRLKIRMMELNHGDQTSAGMIAAHMVENFNRWPLIGDTRLSSETLYRLTLAFFNTQLKGIKASQAILKTPYEHLDLRKDIMVIHWIEQNR